MTKLGNVNIKNSIVTKLITIVFSIYFIVTLSVTAIHMYAEYSNTKQSIIKSLYVIHETFGKSLGVSIWNLDRENIKSTLIGLVNHPFVLGVKIMYQNNKEMQGGYGLVIIDGKLTTINEKGEKQIYTEDEFDTDSLFSVKADIMYKFEDYESETVGKITIYTSNKIVFEEVKYGFAFILVNSVIKTLALWIIFIFIGRKLLTKPLAQISHFVSKIDFDNIELNALKVKTADKNELKMLEIAFNTMVEKLHFSQKNLQNSNEYLALLLNSTKEMAVTGMVQYRVMEIAVTNIVKKLHFKGNSSADIYFFERIGNNLEYTHFNYRIDNSDDGDNKLIQGLSKSYHVPIKHIPFYADEKIHGSNCFIDKNKLVVPCSESENILGLVIFNALDKDKFAKEVENFVNTMAHSLAISLTNIYHKSKAEEKLLLDGQMKAASEVQESFLPQSLPKVGGIDCASYFQSASETGGDWYGFMTGFQDKLYVMIGDVTGHGTPSALITAQASTAFKLLEHTFSSSMSKSGKNFPTPIECLQYLNTAIHSEPKSEYWMTFFVGCIDLLTGEFIFSNAGHNLPMLISDNGQPKPLLNSNPCLGYAQDTQFKESKLQLKKDDVLFLYTDGLIENPNIKKEMWGGPKLIRALKTLKDLPAEKIVEYVVKDAFAFTNNQPMEDDMTLVALKFNRDYS